MKPLFLGGWTPWKLGNLLLGEEGPHDIHTYTRSRQTNEVKCSRTWDLGYVRQGRVQLQLYASTGSRDLTNPSLVENNYTGNEEHPRDVAHVQSATQAKFPLMRFVPNFFCTIHATIPKAHDLEKREHTDSRKPCLGVNLGDSLPAFCGVTNEGL